jgi:predicted HicB family RNase H-like nuclease
MKRVSSKIALDALEVARRIYPSRRVSQSATADKFVVRTTEEIREVMGNLGKHQGRSANAEIVCAIMESIAGRQSASTERKALLQYLGPERSKQVLAGTQPFNSATSRGVSKKVIRLPDGVRNGIADAASRSITEADAQLTSMNTWVVDALVWWINTKTETYALLDACVKMDFHEPNSAPPN